MSWVVMMHAAMRFYLADNYLLSTIYCYLVPLSIYYLLVRCVGIQHRLACTGLSINIRLLTRHRGPGQRKALTFMTRGLTHLEIFPKLNISHPLYLCLNVNANEHSYSQNYPSCQCWLLFTPVWCLYEVWAQCCLCSTGPLPPGGCFTKYEIYRPNTSPACLPESSSRHDVII